MADPSVLAAAVEAGDRTAAGAKTQAAPDAGVDPREVRAAMTSAKGECVPEIARGDFRDVLEATRADGCPTESTLKGISTCRSDPRRPWEWSEIATRMVRG